MITGYSQAREVYELIKEEGLHSNVRFVKFYPVWKPELHPEGEDLSSQGRNQEKFDEAINLEILDPSMSQENFFSDPALRFIPRANPDNIAWLVDDGTTSYVTIRSSALDLRTLGYAEDRIVYSLHTDDYACNLMAHVIKPKWKKIEAILAKNSK